MITLTESAVAKLKEILAAPENQGLRLRVFVTGGGCAGFQYGFALDEQAREDDARIDAGGVEVLVDPASLALLAGSTIDYVASPEGESFVIHNPNAASTCGCGKSFAPAEDGGCAHAEGSCA